MRHTKTGVIPAFTYDEIEILRDYFSKNTYSARNLAFLDIGLNTGLYVQELVKLRFVHFMNANHSRLPYLTFKTTSHEFTPIVFSDKVFSEVLSLYIERKATSINDFLFTAMGHHRSVEHINHSSINRVMHNAIKTTGINPLCSSASMRKTFLSHYWGIKSFSATDIQQRYMETSI